MKYYVDDGVNTGIIDTKETNPVWIVVFALKVHKQLCIMSGPDSNYLVSETGNKRNPKDRYYYGWTLADIALVSKKYEEEFGIPPSDLMHASSHEVVEILNKEL